MQNTSRLRILIIAEAANPDWTSVPLVGWSHAYALAQECDAHLVTQIRNLEAIEGFGWRNGREFTVIDSERLATPAYKLARFIRRGSDLAWTVTTAINSIIYPYFEYLCWQKFKRDLKAGDYDLVHRITPLSPTAPSYLSKKLKKIGVPYVVGPLNGGVAWPKEFKDRQRKEGEWLSNIRNLYKLLPGYRSLRNDTSAIVVGSLATREQLNVTDRDKVFYIPENAVDATRFNLKKTGRESEHIRAAFVGRLVPYKGVDMAIEAIADHCRAGTMTFDIYGVGPEMENLRKLIDDLGLQGKVILHGFVPNQDLQKEFVKADIFLFPSVREFGGGVVLEAMALGVVPLVVNYGGPGELVTRETGFKVELSARQKLIEDLRAMITEIIAKPHDLEVKSELAAQRVQQYFTWEKKAQQMLLIYDWVLSRGARPDFPGLLDSD